MRKAVVVVLLLLAGCGIPVGLGVATFSSAALMGAGLAVGAGAVDVSWAHLPTLHSSPTPEATPSPSLKQPASNPKWLPQDNQVRE